jgi:hypothetical protein
VRSFLDRIVAVATSLAVVVGLFLSGSAGMKW